ncbi:MAG: hypothetical protein AB8H80_00370 [Planctomycetota bacterium]
MPGLKTLLLACSLFLTGCLEFEQTVTLNADGSGSQSVRMKVRERLLAELAQQQLAAQTGAASDLSAVFDEEKVRRELAGAGMELAAHGVERGNGARSVDLTASFADFATLQRSPLSGSSAEWELAAGPKPGLAKMSFYPQGKAAWLEARKRAAAMRDKEDPLVTQFFERQRRRLAGLDLRFRLRLPGKVYLWTRNMKKTGEQEVEAVVTAGQIQTPEDLVRRLAPRFQVVFAADAAKLLAPSESSAKSSARPFPRRAAETVGKPAAMPRAQRGK